MAVQGLRVWELGFTQQEGGLEMLPFLEWAFHCRDRCYARLCIFSLKSYPNNSGESNTTITAPW